MWAAPEGSELLTMTPRGPRTDWSWVTLGGREAKPGPAHLGLASCESLGPGWGEPGTGPYGNVEQLFTSGLSGSDTMKHLSRLLLGRLGPPPGKVFHTGFGPQLPSMPNIGPSSILLVTIL